MILKKNILTKETKKNRSAIFVEDASIIHAKEDEEHIIDRHFEKVPKSI